MRDPRFNGCDSDTILRVCDAAFDGDWTDGGGGRGRRSYVGLDDPSAVCLRAQLSDLQVPASSEQDDGYVGHIRRRFGMFKLLNSFIYFILLLLFFFMG